MTLEEAYKKRRQECLSLQRQLKKAEKTIIELTAGTYVDKDKVIPNSRVKTGKKKGGQPGHKKHTLTHPATEDISETVEHTLESCPKCGGNLKYIGERHKNAKATASAVALPFYFKSAVNSNQKIVSNIKFSIPVRPF